MSMFDDLLAAHGAAQDGKALPDVVLSAFNGHVPISLGVIDGVDDLIVKVTSIPDFIPPVVLSQPVLAAFDTLADIPLPDTGGITSTAGGMLGDKYAAVGQMVDCLRGDFETLIDVLDTDVLPVATGDSSLLERFGVGDTHQAAAMAVDDAVSTINSLVGDEELPTTGTGLLSGVGGDTPVVTTSSDSGTVLPFPTQLATPPAPGVGMGLSAVNPVFGATGIMPTPAMTNSSASGGGTSPTTEDMVRPITASRADSGITKAEVQNMVDDARRRIQQHRNTSNTPTSTQSTHHHATPPRGGVGGQRFSAGHMETTTSGEQKTQPLSKGRTVIGTQPTEPTTSSKMTTSSPSTHGGQSGGGKSHSGSMMPMGMMSAMGRATRGDSGPPGGHAAGNSFTGPDGQKIRSTNPLITGTWQSNHTVAGGLLRPEDASFRDEKHHTGEISTPVTPGHGALGQIKKAGKPRWS